MHYRQKIVRDLLWVLTSPSLLDLEFASGSKSWCETLAELSQHWLQQLDDDADRYDEAVAWLGSRMRGDYVATLLEYWIFKCPVLASTKIRVREQLGKKHTGREVCGLLRYLFECRDFTGVHRTSRFHFETSFKMMLHLDIGSSNAEEKSRLPLSRYASYNLDCNAWHHANIMVQ
jgi:hypothetical protein